MSVLDIGIKMDFKDVLIQPSPSNVNSRSKVVLEKNITKFKYSPHTWNGVPIIAANMDTTGTFSVYNVLSKHKIITALHKFYTLEDYKDKELNPDYFMVSTGISDADFENLKTICDAIDVKWVCIDIANGYLNDLVVFCKKVRNAYPEKIIVAGNCVTATMVHKLIVEGYVDVVKLGIGPGSACTTRLKTGVGMPQFSAILDCRGEKNDLGAHIISDGGITCPGDVSKAFCGGADFVMIGGQFAGHDENPGELIDEMGKKYKLFYGMSSELAQNKHFGKMEKYRSSEGRVIKVPYKGKLEETVLDYLGGVRSTFTYINVGDINELKDKTIYFVKVNQQINNYFGN
jgi:GMP reductase